MRYEFIDEARGLAMIIIISWHTIGIHSSFTDAWAMPIFFFIMGLFYKQEEKFSDLIKKKSKTLLLPLIIFSIPAFILKLIRYGIEDTFMTIINPYKCINGPSWFLICIFWCYLLYWLINRKINEKWTIYIILLLSTLGFYTSYITILSHRIVLPLFLTNSFTCLAFIKAGSLLKKYILQSTNLFFCLTASILSILYLLLFPAPTIDMLWSNYGDQSYIKFIINGISGSILILTLCSLFKNILQPISYIGKFSLVVLVIHGYIGSILKTYTELNNNFINLLLITFISTIISFIINKKLPYLIGK